MCYACKSEKLVNNLKHVSLAFSLSCPRSGNSGHLQPALHSVAAWMQFGRSWMKYEGHHFTFLHYLLMADGISPPE